VRQCRGIRERLAGSPPPWRPPRIFEFATVKRKRELERILNQYDLDHAEQGGIALKLFEEAEHGRMIAGEIAEILFADLPGKNRCAIGDMLDRDLDRRGRGWLRPLVTGGHLRPVLKPH
jgi:hypothetical protein